MAKLQDALMSFIDRNIWTKAAVDESRVLDVIIDPWTEQYGIDKPADIENFGKVYQANENVYTCVKIIAEASNDVPMDVLESKMVKGEQQYVVVENSSNPIKKLFMQVNGNTTENEFKEQSLSSLELQGNSYWWVVRNSLNIPTELYFMRPDYVTIIPDPNIPGGVKAYKYGTAGREDKFDASEVLHFKYFNPRSQFYGQSPLEAARVTIESDMYSKVYNKNFFRNSARPYGVLKSKVNLDNKTKKRLKQMWAAAHQGADKAYRTALLEGDLDYKQLGISQKDSEFISQIKMYREVILAIFKIPPAMMNIYEYANYANAEAQRKIFWTDVMTKKLNKIASYINEFLLFPIWGDQYKVRFNYDDIEVLRESENDKIDRVVKQVMSGLMTLEAAREELGNEGTGTYYLPMNMIPVGASFSKEIKKKTIANIEVAKNLNQTRERGISQIRARYNSALGDMFNDQGLKLTRDIEAIIKAQDKSVKVVDEPPFINVEKLWNDGDYDEMIKGLSAHFIGSFMEQGADTARTLTGIDVVFGLDSPALQGASETLLSKLTSRTSLTSKVDLQKIITDAIENNTTVDKMTRDIRNMMKQKWGDEYPKYRAERIARTEASQAYGEGSHEYYKAAGIPSHQWLTMNDSLVSDACYSNQSEGVIPINQAFSSGDIHEPQHVNCRCSVVPVSEE